MANLYVANLTKQRRDFFYRVPEELQPRRQMIEPGQQILIYRRDAAPEIVSNIIKQHEKYGLIDIKEIDRRKPFVGLCYSDRPIPMQKFMYADEHNMALAEQRSGEERRLTGAALAKAIDNVTRRGDPRLDALDIDLLEQNGPTEPGINERVSYRREGQASRTDEAEASVARRRRRGA